MEDRFQYTGKFPRTRPLCRIFLQQPRHYLRQPTRCGQAGQRLGKNGHHGRLSGPLTLAQEWRVTLQRAEKRDTQRPQIGRGPHGSGRDPLGGHELRRAQQHALAGDRHVPGNLGNSEIHQEDRVIVGHHDVGWLHVTMQHGSAVRRAQPTQHRQPYLSYCPFIQRVIPDDRGQGTATDIIHDDPRVAVREEHVVYADNGRVLHPGQRPRLSHCPSPALLQISAAADMRQQFLQGHRPFQ